MNSNEVHGISTMERARAFELPPGIIPDENDSTDRRTRGRQSYRVLQWVAFCPGGEPPDGSMFRQVRCHDISQGGMSFYSHQPPLDEFLVVALGSGGNRTFVKARVANCIRVSDGSEGSEATFRVGCQFLQRIELDLGDSR